VATGRLAVRLPLFCDHAVGLLRLTPVFLIGVVSIVLHLCVRGEQIDAALDLELRKLASAERFTVNADDVLTPLGQRIPSGKLASDGWVAVSAWATLSPQAAALPAKLEARVALRVVRSNEPAAANVLIASRAAFVAWAVDAPAVRLRPLSFAASRDGRVLVRGEPLPPIPGKRFVERDGVATPAGFVLWPALDAPAVQALLGIAAGDVALFDEEASWEQISAGDFVAATRTAVRATVADLHGKPDGKGGHYG
jgi:hypothetical protein